MYKNKVIKNIIFLIFLLTIISVLISVSVACTPMKVDSKKFDSGTKIVKINNEKYKIKWEAITVSDYNSKELYKEIYIDYNSLKNKKNKGYLSIELSKTSKNKLTYHEKSSSMELASDKIITTKFNTNKYYWNKLRPKIHKLTKNSILNKATLKFNNLRYVNKTITDPAMNEIANKTYKMNWKVYYYTKTSSIEITERYTELKSNKSYPGGNYNYNQDIRIDKYSKGKLKITTFSYGVYTADCTSPFSYKYVKTKLSPKQYYLKVYKNKLETKKLA